MTAVQATSAIPTSAIPDAARVQARILYDNSNCSLEEIAATLDLSPKRFQRARRDWGWPKRPLKRLRCLRLNSPLASEEPRAAPLALADKIEAQLRRELDAVETMLAQDPAAVLPATAAEKRARTIASLVRALVELRRLDVPNRVEEAEDDEFPASLEDLRAELARRIDRLRQGGEFAGADEDA
jgi:hypothetical protein